MLTRFWLLIILMLLVFTGFFLLAESLNIPLLTDPYSAIGVYGISAALAGVGLLIADVILPIPSSLIMIANGALFGVLMGTTLSLVGSLGAALVGFALGRSSTPVIARWISPEERSQANRLLENWGTFAIILTRPIPLLAETTAIVAGMSTMKLRPFTLAAFAGVVPSSLLYAITGATAVSLDNIALSFGLVLLMAGFFWVVGRRFHSVVAGKLKEEVR